MSNILITGGAGFIGSNFIKICLENDHKIKVVDKLTYASNIKNIPNSVDFIKKDICDISEKDIIFDNDFPPHYIVNFAAETHVDNSIKDGKPFIKSNIEGVFNLLELTKNLIGPSFKFEKFIQISTDEVYGDIEKKESKETDNLNPSSYYSATKAAADMLVKSAHRTYGIPYIITRTCNNFGIGQHEEKFIPKIKKCLQENKHIPVYSPGNQVREWIHVNCNCEAIYKLMMSDKINEIYNIGSGKRYTNLEVINILDKDNKANVRMVEDRLGHDKRYALNNNKYKSEFGKASFISLQEYYGKKK